MGTINQPKPSQPKPTQPEQQPLQPGGPVPSRDNSADLKRPNVQTPDSQRDKIRDDR